MGKKYKIQKDVAGIFKHYKKYIPCFNRACLAAPSCCTVKKASKKAKYLAYTITLKEPCIEAYKIFSIITSISE